MRLLSRVCADFYDRNRNLIHKITQRDLGLYHDVPDAIQQDPLFQMLVDDESILLADTPEKQKSLENDPFAGATAEGKAIKPKTTRTKTQSKPASKTEPKQESNPDPDPDSSDNSVGIDTK